MSTDHRSWTCPTCARASSSSRAVRARWCARCSVWCARGEESPDEEPGRVDLVGRGEPGDSIEFTGTAHILVREVLFEAEGEFYGFNGTPGQA